LNKHQPTAKSRRFLRKRQVAARYGVDERTVDRMAKDGRLPAYIYLPGSKLPLQDEDELDARDDAAAAARATGKPVVAALETRDGA
jgi:predicted DNA-binding transcriptional regulator AlpA